MIKKGSKYILATALLTTILTGCSNHEAAIKVMPNELAQANQCIDTNKEFETDCYDLIKYKNSIALIRLGIKEYAKGNFTEAFNLYQEAQRRGNFYANSLLADLYNKGKGVKKNHKKAIELLEDVQEVDPIAAYKLSFVYINEKEYEEAIKLLEFASNNEVKDAQKKLSEIYAEGKIVKVNKQRSEELKNIYKNRKRNFLREIYGI